MSEPKFTEDHAWIRDEGDGVVLVGISDYAQNELGDIVYVELPEVGRVMNRGDAMVVIESVKAAGDVSMPVSGTIRSVNEELVDSPELVNADPETDGWLVMIDISDPHELHALMDEEHYRRFVEEL